MLFLGVLALNLASAEFNRPAAPTFTLRNFLGEAVEPAQTITVDVSVNGVTKQLVF